MIELRKVTKIYEDSVKAVDDISFEVQEGEIFGLIGTSGCGKTTTLKMINRLVNPSSGQVLVNNQDVSTEPVEMLRRNIGYVIQSVGLFPHYTIRENVTVVPKLLKWDSSQIEQRYQELMQLVGLSPSDFADRHPDALSGGQQQRVGFARALAADPDLILMDEPFGALDPITKEQIREEFKKLLEQIDKTIVLVTHDVQEAFDLCDRIALMDNGSIRQIGTPKELLLNPANEFVSSFFAFNRLELEMQTFTIQDLLDITEVEKMPKIEDSKKVVSVEPQTTVAQILHEIDVAKTEIIYLVVEADSGSVQHLKVDDLLSNFNKLRQRAGGMADG